MKQTKKKRPFILPQLTPAEQAAAFACERAKDAASKKTTGYQALGVQQYRDAVTQFLRELFPAIPAEEFEKKIDRGRAYRKGKKPKAEKPPNPSRAVFERPWLEMLHQELVSVPLCFLHGRGGKAKHIEMDLPEKVWKLGFRLTEYSCRDTLIAAIRDYFIASRAAEILGRFEGHGGITPDELVHLLIARDERRMARTDGLRRGNPRS